MGGEVDRIPKGDLWPYEIARFKMGVFADAWNLKSVQEVSKQTRHFRSKPSIYYGAGSRIRTDDLLITNQLLYQLSYAGENAAHISAHRRPEQVANVRSVDAS
jgi:hypothetical protein